MTYSASLPGTGRPSSLNARVIADTLPRGLARDVALVVGGAGFVGLTAQLAFHVPWTPVPYTMQTFAVLLTGAALGPLRGLLSMALYLLAGGFGVPWFTNQASGFGGVTFGYVVGFVLAGAVVGAFAASRRPGADTEKSVTRSPFAVFGLMILGSLLIYAVGVPWLAHEMGMTLSKAITVGARPFLLGDALKALLAAGLLPGAWKLVDRT